MPAGADDHLPPPVPDRIDYALNAGDHSWSIDRSGNVRISDIEDRNGAAFVVTRDVHVGLPRVAALITTLGDQPAGNPVCIGMAAGTPLHRLGITNGGKRQQFSAFAECRTGSNADGAIAAQLARIAYADAMVEGWAKSGRVIDGHPLPDRRRCYEVSA